jgi:hypothetical protein
MAAASWPGPRTARWRLSFDVAVIETDLHLARCKSLRGGLKPDTKNYRVRAEPGASATVFEVPQTSGSGLGQ